MHKKIYTNNIAICDSDYYYRSPRHGLDKGGTKSSTSSIRRQQKPQSPVGGYKVLHEPYSKPSSDPTYSGGSGFGNVVSSASASGSGTSPGYYSRNLGQATSHWPSKISLPPPRSNGTNGRFGYPRLFFTDFTEQNFQNLEFKRKILEFSKNPSF